MDESPSTPSRVRIADIDMPFWSMVVFMVKWAIASIPAILILAFLGVAVATMVGGLGAAFLSRSSVDTGSSSDLRAAFDSLLTPQPTVGAAPVGGWILSESKNPIDDSPTVVLTLDSKAAGGGRFGSSPTLFLRCRSNQTELYISWGEYLGLEETNVTVRTGRNRARSSEWSISTDNRATFYPGSPIAFIKELIAVDTMIAMTTPYGESPVTAVFPVAGLEEKITPLRTACRW